MQFEPKIWSEKEDALYISPVLGLPGNKHTIGIARVWHFLIFPFKWLTIIDIGKKENYGDATG